MPRSSSAATSGEPARKPAFDLGQPARSLQMLLKTFDVVIARPERPQEGRWRCSVSAAIWQRQLAAGGS
jgi:hypothetical protein